MSEAMYGQCPYCHGSLINGHICPKRNDVKAPEVKVKKFVVIPADAFDLLTRRHAELDDATEAATEACSEEGQRMYVVEMRAVASRADRPVKVSKL